MAASFLPCTCKRERVGWCASFFLVIFYVVMLSPSFHFGSLCGVDASIIITHNTSSWAFDDVPALFGPHIPAGPSKAIKGLLQIASPNIDACSPLNNKPPLDPVSGSLLPFVILARRSALDDPDSCHFAQKVFNAEAVGAVAAIIYDDRYEPPYEMIRNRGDPDPHIPSTFVDLTSGLFMEKQISRNKPNTVRVDMYDDGYPASFFDSVGASFAAAFSAAAVTSLLFVMRSQSARRRRMANAAANNGADDAEDSEPLTMTRAAVCRLPCFAFGTTTACAAVAAAEAAATSETATAEEGGDVESGLDYEASDHATCAVCLEDYEPREQLRELPCKHRFHKSCIDQWLTTRRAMCPICKHDARRPLEEQTTAQDDNEETDATDDEGNDRSLFAVAEGAEEDESSSSVSGDDDDDERHSLSDVVVEDDDVPDDQQPLLAREHS